MRSHRFLTGLSLSILLFVYGSVAAQTPRRNFDRAQTYDVEHYVLRVSFDRKAKKVLGETTIRFKPLKNDFVVAEFDAVDISFGSVSTDPGGTPLKFRTSGGKIIVTLDKAYSATDTVAIRFKHSSVP